MAQKTFRSLEEEDYKKFLNRCTPFLEKYPNNLNIWVYQAKAAMVINNENAGAIAAQKIKALGGFNSTNPEMRKLMINLNEKGYFDKNLGLLAAVMYSQPDVALKLIQAGAYVNAKDNKGYTALRSAAYKGQTEAIKILIQAGADINAKDKYGYTALMNAAEKGQTEVVKALIQAGADLNAKDNIYGGTALLWAADEGHAEVVKALIQAGADVNFETVNNFTALHYAAIRGRTEIVKALIQAGADVNFKTKYGDTALMKAKTREIEELLRNAGAR